MSVISYLRLDAEYDVVWDNTATLTDLDAVAQAIQTRLLLFQGEWWENLAEGTPMFQSILGKRASGVAAMTILLSSRIVGTPYVQSVQDVQVVFNPITRTFSYSATALTAFGPTPVVFNPGAAAGTAQ